MSANTTNPAAKGRTTSEFIAFIASNLGVIALSYGVITLDQVDAFTQLVTGVMTVVIAIAAIWKMNDTYTKGRLNLKDKLIDKGLPTEETPTESSLNPVEVPQTQVGQPIQ